MPTSLRPFSPLPVAESMQPRLIARDGTARTLGGLDWPITWFAGRVTRPSVCYHENFAIDTLPATQALLSLMGVYNSPPHTVSCSVWARNLAVGAGESRSYKQAECLRTE